VSSAIEPVEPRVRVADSVRTHWTLVLCFVVLAVLGAGAYVLLADEKYRAEANLLVAPIPQGDATLLGIPLIREANETRGVLTAARLIKTPQIAQAVVERLGLEIRFDQLLARVEVIPQEQSNVVTVVAEAGTPSAAAALANAFVEVIIARRKAEFQRGLRQIMQRLSDRLESIPGDRQDSAEAASISERLSSLRTLVGASDPTLSILSPAVAPREPISPRPRLSLIVALTVGLALGVASAYVRDALSPEIRRESDLVAENGLRVLGRIPPVLDARPYFAGDEAVPAKLSDAYRTLRANLATAGPERTKPRTVLVTSASHGEGKASAAAHLALATAVGGTRTVLVDADLRGPKLGSLFDVEAHGKGLAGLIAGSETAARSLVPVAQFKALRLLLASSEDGRLLDVDYSEVASVSGRLRRTADLVVFDSPPLTEAEDALPLANMVDAVVIVITIGSSRRDRLRELRELLERLGVTPAGLIIMRRPGLRTHLRALSSWRPGDVRRDEARARAPRRAPARGPARWNIRSVSAAPRHQVEEQASVVEGERRERREDR
jgi:Mrp family chromosome partitioning ATPase/capsular polysaccharide biosynthesis protein